MAAAAAVRYFFIHHLLISVVYNDTAKSVPIASRNRVNCGYDIHIEYLRKNGKSPHGENMDKKYPLVLSTCELNIHLPVSDPFCLGPRRRDRRPGIVGPEMARVAAHQRLLHVGIGPLSESVQAPCNLNRPCGRAQEVARSRL